MTKRHEELIIGFLKGNLTQDEKNQFYLWLDETPENKKLFFEIKAVYDISVSSQKPLQIEKSWKKLLLKKGSDNSVKKKKLWLLVTSYAASILIAIILTSTYFLWLLPKSEPTVVQYIGGDGLGADIVVLADGTEISLGGKTTVSYDSDYGITNRDIYLEGEAYFNVAQGKKPFVVKVNGQEIEALGTQFNVMAYPMDSIYTTTLLKGSIRLTTENFSQPVILKPNEQFVYNKNKNTIETYAVNARQFTAWTTGYYYFPEQSLYAILNRLSNVYGIQFTILTDKVKDTLFTGTFYRGQSIKDIMEIIQLAVPIGFEIDDHKVTITD